MQSLMDANHIDQRFFFGRYTYRMDKWLTVSPDLEPLIGSAFALYSLYCPKKKS
jgi:hypothetical protein